MTERTDSLGRAFDALRSAHGSELPSPEVERRLRARHGELLAAPRWTRRRLAAAALVLVLSGAAFAASGGLRWLGRWWYALEVDGQRATGSVEGAGERTFTFETDDGGTATVRVLREPTAAGATRTRIEFERAGEDGVQQEAAEDVVGGSVERVRLPLSVLGDAPPVLEGIDAEGRPYALHLLPDGRSGSRVLVHRVGYGALPVEELARVPVVLGREGSAVAVEELPRGGFAIEFADGHGRELRVEWSGEPDARTGSELRTQDGRVRVRVDGPPDEH